MLAGGRWLISPSLEIHERQIKARELQGHAAIAEIERRYEIGHAVLEKCGPLSPTGMIKEEARKHGISRDTCQKLRAMADVKTGYSRGELAKLYAKFQDAEHALTISHFVKLVSVPKGKRRT